MVNFLKLETQGFLRNPYSVLIFQKLKFKESLLTKREPVIKVCVFFCEELSDVVIEETSSLVTIPKVLVPIGPDINV